MSPFEEALQLICGDEAPEQRNTRLGLWEAAGCYLLDAGLATVVFDAAVHCGVPQAIRWLQQAVGDEGPRGVITPQTRVRIAQADPRQVILRVTEARVEAARQASLWFGEEYGDGREMA